MSGRRGLRLEGIDLMFCLTDCVLSLFCDSTWRFAIFSFF
jgi:hypothetical protein